MPQRESCELKKIIPLLAITIIIFFSLFSYFYLTKIKIGKEFTFLETELKKEIPQPIESPTFFIPTRIKSYTIEINKDFLVPAGISVEKGDKIEFRLKNQTKEKVIFKTNQDLGIIEDIVLGPEEEKSLNFTSPDQVGEYKFIITTSQANLEGLLIVR